MNLTKKGAAILKDSVSAPVIVEYSDGMITEHDTLAEALETSETVLRSEDDNYKAIIYMAVGAVTKNKKGKLKHVQILGDSEDD